LQGSKNGNINYSIKNFLAFYLNNFLKNINFFKTKCYFLTSLQLFEYNKIITQKENPSLCILI